MIFFITKQNTGSPTTKIDISTGYARSSDNTTDMFLSSVLDKQIAC